jgi:hypothetical protein
MTLKEKRNGTLELQANHIKPRTEKTSASHAPSHDEIRRRAYEIYLERDGLGGNEVDDWLRAEAELGENTILARTAKETRQKA